MYKSGEDDQKKSLKAYLKSKQFLKDASYIKQWITVFHDGFSKMAVASEIYRACKNINKTGALECNLAKATAEHGAQKDWAALFKKVK